MNGILSSLSSKRVWWDEASLKVMVSMWGMFVSCRVEIHGVKLPACKQTHRQPGTSQPFACSTLLVRDSPGGKCLCNGECLQVTGNGTCWVCVRDGYLRRRGWKIELNALSVLWWLAGKYVRFLSFFSPPLYCDLDYSLNLALFICSLEARKPVCVTYPQIQTVLHLMGGWGWSLKHLSLYSHPLVFVFCHLLRASEKARL